jgi:hypothetical protein
MRGVEGSGGGRDFNSVSKLLILLILPAGSSPSLSTAKIRFSVRRAKARSFSGREPYPASFAPAGANQGAAGVDGERFEDIEAYGNERWLGGTGGHTQE